MSYQLNKVHLLICIFAGVVLAGGFVWQLVFTLPVPNTLFTMAWWVSLGIVLFYCVGAFARSFLIQQVFVPIEDEYNLAEDEEYQAFVKSLETQNEPSDVMFDDPLHDLNSYDDSLNDPFMEPLPLEDAS
ncbi:MAG: hypothetical protein LBI27_04370 [Clostridiales bacterium]|jgi:hypothetical protein|nr:hypothetical protein [Clostridiales bacterium]